MKRNIGLQLYTLMDKCTEDYDKVLKYVSEIGYDGLEFHSYGGYEAKELKKFIDSLNLKSISTHVPSDQYEKNIDDIIRYNTILESKYIVMPYMKSDSRDEWLTNCEFLNKYGKILREHGFDFLYHNHNFELIPINDNENAMDIILANTSPEYVSIEADCFWLKYADVEPEEFLIKNIDRIKTIHVKDMAAGSKDLTEVGTGIIDYDNIIKACAKAGMKWFIVEQDRTYIDPFQSVKISLENLRTI